MNYKLMSDFDINKAVAIKLNYTVTENFKWEDEQCWIKAAKDKEPTKIFDYCGDANDAWPIIIENEIGINKLKCEPLWIADKGGSYVRDKNPLRAAMIVFLMMNDK